MNTYLPSPQSRVDTAAGQTQRIQSFSLELVRQNIKQCFSHFSMNHLRIVLKMQIPLQDDWGGGQDFAFLTSFKVILVLPAQGPQPEKRGTR